MTTGVMKNGIRLRGRIYWVRYYRNGRRHEESSHSTKHEDAKRLLKVREGDVARGVPVTPKIGRLRFEEAAEDLLNDYRTNGKRSLDDVERRIDKHLKPFFGGRRMTAITTADVRAYIAKRQADTIIVWKAYDVKRKDGTVRRVPEQRRTIAAVSNGEINRELTALKRSFRLAMQAGKLLAVPHTPMLKERNTRTGFFEREQFESVQSHLPPAIQPVTTFAYVTGWRVPSEVLPLQWRQIDFDEKISPDQRIAGTVRLDPGTTKNDEGRVFPFTAELRTLLEDQRQTANRLAREKGVICPWVFHRNGRPIKSFVWVWRTACRLAGCPGRIAHDFRRTAVRNLVRVGVPERVAMQLTGHKTRSVFERYNIVSSGDLAAAAVRLEEAAPATGQRSRDDESPVECPSCSAASHKHRGEFPLFASPARCEPLRGRSTAR